MPPAVAVPVVAIAIATSGCTTQVIGPIDAPSVYDAGSYAYDAGRVDAPVADAGIYVVDAGVADTGDAPTEDAPAEDAPAEDEAPSDP